MQSKIFISHSTLDKDYVSDFVELLENIGLNEHQIFCSSLTGFGVPLGCDIYDYLKEQFCNYNLHVIFILSENYYNSVACLNEMGAAWGLRSKYTTILLPKFEFRQIKGAINPREIALKLDNDLNDVKERLGQLKDILLKEFTLETITDVRWEQKRDKFIEAIYKYHTKKQIYDSTIFDKSNDTKYDKTNQNIISELALLKSENNELRQQLKVSTIDQKRSIVDITSFDLEKVTLVFENCESIDVNAKYIGTFSLGTLENKINRIAINSVSKQTFCNDTAISISANYNNLSNSSRVAEIVLDTLPFDRLKTPDITGIHIWYKNGMDEYIYVSWDEENEYENKWQKNYYDEYGNAYIVISPNKQISDYFNIQELNKENSLEYLYL